MGQIITCPSCTNVRKVEGQRSTIIRGGHCRQTILGILNGETPPHGCLMARTPEEIAASSDDILPDEVEAMKTGYNGKIA